MRVFPSALLLASATCLAFGCSKDEADNRESNADDSPALRGGDAGDMFGNSRLDGGVPPRFWADAAPPPPDVCGNADLTEAEECDDGNERSGDGCSEDCELEPGWACLSPGARCVAAECGDGILAGDEECEDDDASPEDGDGCSAKCRFEPGFDCGAPGEACHATQCNDGTKERGEPCDDGNDIVGDGCTPFCEIEPDCADGACRSRCGDGITLPSDDEECDDGNTESGDGCSAECQTEEGYTCTLETSSLPDVLQVPVTYRDFIALPAAGAVAHPDFQVFSGSDVTPGLVTDTLGTDGKPVYAGICDDAAPTGAACPYDQQLTTQDNFDQWYRDVPGVNVGRVTRMDLTRDPTDGAYRIAQSNFFPFDGDPVSFVATGKENASGGHDFGFTSEVRHYFEYAPDPANPQTLTFSGDDDVWVFINHKLAVDIGGLHAQQNRSVVLDAATAAQLGLDAGKIYEIALFHAERHTSQSNFNLTLNGFVAAKSSCLPRCGDGIVAGLEECDDGDNAGGYGGCMPDCTLGPRCGDGLVQESAGEECDDGNLTGADTCSTSCQEKVPG